MSRIQTNCPKCGAVKMDSSDILLVPVKNQWRFTCPQCGTPWRKATNEKIITILRDAGVTEAVEDPDLTTDEVEKLVKQLNDPKEGWREELGLD